MTKSVDIWPNYGGNNLFVSCTYKELPYALEKLGLEVGFPKGKVIEKSTKL